MIRSPKNIVITGGTRGLGRALVRHFAASGDNVLFTARRKDDVDRVIADDYQDTTSVSGIACDVAYFEDMRAKISDSMPHIDLFINNAGVSGGFTLFEDVHMYKLQEVVNTNIIGTMAGCKIAIEAKKLQVQPLHVVNVIGAGSDGMPTPNFAAYGATKAAISQFTRSLRKESDQDGYGIRVHTLSPGMLVTELLLQGTSNREKGFFNIFAEEPDNVARLLVPQLQQLVLQDKKHQDIVYLTPARIIARALTFQQRKSRFFDV